MDRSAGLTGKTSFEKINIVSAKKQLLLKKQKKAPLGRCRYGTYHLLREPGNAIDMK